MHPTLAPLASRPPHHQLPGPQPTHPMRWWLYLVAQPLLALCAGCASLPPETTLATTHQRLGVDAERLALHRLATQRDAARAAAEAALSAGALDADTALRLALVNSPALQALLAEAWARDLDAGASALPTAPRLGWERLVHGGGVEFTTTLAVGLTDLVLWPARQQAADHARAANRLALAQQVLAHQQAVRQQWLRAVAAAELRGYQTQVADLAQAASDLAERMQAAGHFSRLQRTREAALAADAQARLARAELARQHEAEALVRLLGLQPEQAQRLQLPTRLPTLPGAVAQAQRLATLQAEATRQPRLDMALAQQAVQALQAQPSLTAQAFDVEAEAARVREGDNRARALTLSLAAPLDGGSHRRAQHEARLLAAQARLDQAQRAVDSQLRQHLATTTAAWQAAQQARQTLVPLYQTLADETLLRTNGMLSSVFDLLAATRAQVGAVLSAIEAQRDFWLADAALQAALAGVPASNAAPSEAGRAATTATEAAAH